MNRSIRSTGPAAFDPTVQHRLENIPEGCSCLYTVNWFIMVIKDQLVGGDNMLIKQISIFLENKHGRLAEVTQLLGDNHIDISALSIADTADFGILRLIVNQPDKAKQVLDQYGFTVSINQVIAIEVEDKPGGLSKALAVLDNKGIGIEYMYAFVGNAALKNAMVILRVENPESVIQVLKDEDISIASSKSVYRE